MIDVWCNRIIRFSFFLLFILVPVILTPWNYELFEFNKMMVTYALTAVIMTAWVVKMVSEREFRIARTPFDIPILLFVLSQFISALYSIDPHVSWFGYYSRFNGGMWSVISYVLLFYAFVSNISDLSFSSVTSERIKGLVSAKSSSIIRNTYTVILLRVSLITATIVALYGVLERMGIDKNLWVQDVQNRVFSTLGQPNWLAAYLVALYPVSLAFAILEKTNSTEKKHIRFSFWTALSLLFFIVLIFTRSRSGLAGIAAASVIFWTGAWYFFTQNRRIVRNFFIGLHITIFVFLFFHGSNVGRYDQYLTLRGLRARFEASQVQDAAPQTATDTLLVTGGTESGTIRRFVWQGALNAWRSSTKTFLIGTGTESFAFAFYQFKSKEHNMTSEWDFLYNKAHNEYLNYLATTGIFGLGSYVLFVGTFVIWFFKNQMSKLKAQSNVKAQSLKNSLTVGFDSTFDIRILPIALFVGWLSVLVTNFFGFSVVVTQLFLFLFPAMIITITRGESVQQFRHLSLPLRPGVVSLARGLIGVFGLLLVLRLASVWYADMSYAAGYRLARAGSYERSKDFLSRAIALLPSEPLYHDEMSTTLAALTTAAIEDSKNATRAAELAQAAMQESDRALTVSPKNVNFWKSRTKILYSFSSFNPELNKTAIDALKNAQMLSPTDPKIAYNLAILWGREGDNGQAIDLLKQAIDLKPNYRDAYYALFVFYTDTGQIPVARTILTQYLTDVDPKDQDFQDKLKQL